ncbi:MAG: hypothetical protein L0154_03590 [Chloroflexi bacterium]|nr:hypothetical protein [Chloroflexota bacterium]
MKRAFLLLIGIFLLASTLSTAAQTDPVMVIDTPPPAVLYVGDTFTVEFSCRDPQTNEVILASGYGVSLYRAGSDELVSITGGMHSGGPQPAQATFKVPTNEPGFYYLQLGFSGCDPINSSVYEVREVATPELAFTLQPPSSTYTTLSFDTKVQHSEDIEGIPITLALYDNSTGLVIDPQLAQEPTNVFGEARFLDIHMWFWEAGEYYLMASAPGLPDVQSNVFTVIRPVMVVDTQPPPILYTDETFLVVFSCRDPQTNEGVPVQISGYVTELYLASTDQQLEITLVGGIAFPQITYLIEDLSVEVYYVKASVTGCDPINTDDFEIREVAAPTLSFTLQPQATNYTTLYTSVRVQHSENAEGVPITLALYDNISGMEVPTQYPPLITNSYGRVALNTAIWNAGEYYFVASSEGLADVQSNVFTMIQPVWTIDSPPLPLLYTDETFVVEFSCRDPQTNEIVNWDGGTQEWELYLAATDEWVSGIYIGIAGIPPRPALMTYTIQNLEPEHYYIRVYMSGCGEVITNDFEIRERPVPPTDTPMPPTDTPVPPTDTPTGPVALVASAACVGPDLVVDIVAGDGPFDITASTGINVPVTGVSSGQTVIAGPDKWDDVTVTETGGDLEATNLGTFKCRPPHKPVPLSPAHRATVNTSTPTFTWAGIPDANNYRLFLFDDPVLANRTVDIRENTGSAATSLIPTQSLLPGRYFWRVRGRVNGVWGYWSVRFTLFVE